MRIPAALRRLVAAILIPVGAAAVLLALAPPLIFDRDIEKNQRIVRQFEEAAEKIRAFEHKHQRRPNADELVGLIPPADYDIMLLADGSQCTDSRTHFEKRDGPLLTIWRGEWSECYSIDSRRHTLTLDANDFAMTGRIWLDVLLFAFAAFGSIFASFLLWTRQG